jgi:hypothetical protein
MGQRVCAEPFCTREAVLGPYCRTHARDEVRRTEKTLASAVRKADIRRFKTFPQGAWAEAVAVTLEGIAAEEHPVDLERHVETLLKLLAGHPDPADSLAHSRSWGGIKRSLTTITTKLRDQRVAFSALAGSPGIGETDPRVRTLLHRLELYATCLAALKMRKALELLESYGTLRKTLEQRAGETPSRIREPLEPPSTLSSSDGVRAAADFVRRVHDGERSSLAELARGRERGLFAGELMIAELVWDMVGDQRGAEFVEESFNGLIAAAFAKRAMRAAVQAVADRTELRFRERWVDVDEEGLADEDVGDTNLALATVIDTGVSRLGGDDADRWPWLLDQVVEVVLADTTT